MITISPQRASLAVTSAFLFLPVMQAAHAEPVVFGTAKLSVAAIDDDIGNAISVSSHSSRVGIKGSSKTEDGLEILYRFAWQIDMTDEEKTSSDHIKSREQYVGLRDHWGELRVGRHDTPYKTAGKKHVELFSDSWADYNNIISKPMDIRANDSVSYYNAFDNINFSLMYAAGDDTPAGDNINDITSAKIEILTGGILLAAAYQDADQVGTGIKLVAGFNTGSSQFGFIVESVDPDPAGASQTNLLGSFKTKLDDTNTLKVAIGQADAVAGDDPLMLAAGIDHRLNPQTKVYALLVIGRDNGLLADAKLVGDSKVAAVGIEASF
jgi:predicted porin